MREIKFRARRVSDGAWVYGTYAKHISNFVIFDEDTGERHVVDPTTLGQWTGLKDKNGVEIYEGDILQSGGWSCDRPFVVQWGDINNDHPDEDFVLGVGFEIFDPHGVPHSYEVIGNTHEHPHLIKKDEA